MQQNCTWIMRMDIVCNTINGKDSFFCIGSEEPIENYQYATKVFINVFGIAGVMHPVIWRRIKHQVKKTKFFYFLSMNDKIPDGC